MVTCNKPRIHTYIHYTHADLSFTLTSFVWITQSHAKTNKIRRFEVMRELLSAGAAEYSTTSAEAGEGCAEAGLASPSTLARMR